MSRTKVSVWVIVFTLAFAVTMFVLPITPRVPVKTVAIERGSLKETISMTARVSDKGETVYGALVGGRVSDIYVSAGDYVAAGDRLFSLDDSYEKQALGALLSAIEAGDSAGGAYAYDTSPLTAVTLQNQLDLISQAETLKRTIELKTVRADADGVVKQLYIRKGELLADMTVALLVGSDERELLSTQRAQDMARVTAGMTGTVRVGEDIVGSARVSGFSAPGYQEALMTYAQTLRMDLFAVSPPPVGTQTQVELLLSETPDVPLAPLTAVSESGRIWVVRDGKAYPEAVDLSKRSDEWLLVGDELEGLSVVLAPDESRLKSGCAVKEQVK